MKKKFIFSLAIILCTLTSFGQASHTTADIFKIDKITWLGLDFSEIRLIGPEGFTDPKDIFSRQIPSMNDLIINESQKYTLGKFFSKTDVTIDLSVVSKRNDVADPDKMVLETNAKYDLDEAGIQAIIKQYKPEESEGIGLVFIMEKFDKPSQMADMWVTFFDFASKQVLLTQKMSAKAGGIGFRNYWAGAIYKVMKTIEKKQYAEWKKKYS